MILLRNTIKRNQNEKKMIDLQFENTMKQTFIFFIDKRDKNKTNKKKEPNIWGNRKKYDKKKEQTQMAVKQQQNEPKWGYIFILLLLR